MKRNEYDCCKISGTCSVECSIKNKMFVVFRWNDSSNLIICLQIIDHSGSSIIIAPRSVGPLSHSCLV